MLFNNQVHFTGLSPDKKTNFRQDLLLPPDDLLMVGA
jgi:hypothetical protein